MKTKYTDPASGQVQTTIVGTGSSTGRPDTNTTKLISTNYGIVKSTTTGGITTLRL